MKLLATILLAAVAGYAWVTSPGWWPVRFSRSPFWRDELQVEPV